MGPDHCLWCQVVRYTTWVSRALVAYNIYNTQNVSKYTKQTQEHLKGGGERIAATYKLKLRNLWKLAQHSNLLRRKLRPHIEKPWVQTTVRKLLEHGGRHLYKKRTHILQQKLTELPRHSEISLSSHPCNCQTASPEPNRCLPSPTKTLARMPLQLAAPSDWHPGSVAQAILRIALLKWEMTSRTSMLYFSCLL